MKVAFIGTHGVGKTTLCFELAALLKKRDKVVEMVREVARFCPLPINRDTTVAAQSWILHTEIAEELAAENKAEIVICDRSVLDNYCYLLQTGKHAMLEPLVRWWTDTYNLLIKVPIVGSSSTACGTWTWRSSGRSTPRSIESWPSGEYPPSDSTASGGDRGPPIRWRPSCRCSAPSSSHCSTEKPSRVDRQSGGATATSAAADRVRHATAPSTIAPPTSANTLGRSPTKRKTQRGLAMGSTIPIREARVAVVCARPRTKRT